jgi:antitoxin component of MazEF toxin-antitoxin module
VSHNNEQNSKKNNINRIVPKDNIANKKKKPSLEELMDKITPENQHDEVDWGKPEGDELI